jgi:hypothetical protein
VLNVQRDNLPQSDFGKTTDTQLGLFPYLFLTGQIGNGIKETGPWPIRFLRHLLRQRTNTFSSDKNFLFYHSDSLRRVETIRSSSAVAKSNPRSYAPLNELLADTDAFLAQVDRAVASPTTSETKKLMNRLDPLFKFIGSRVGGSAMHRNAAITDMIAFDQFFGPSNVFFTMSFSEDRSSALIFRLGSVPIRDLQRFPAADDGFLVALRKKLPVFLELPISKKSDFQKVIDNNPVRAVQVFKQFLEKSCSVLLGCPIDEHGEQSRLTKPSSLREPGIFGECRALYTSIEAQARRTLHAHMKLHTVLAHV